MKAESKPYPGAAVNLTRICLAGIAAFTAIAAAASEPSDHTKDPFWSRPCQATEPCHHTWTLTSRLGAILEDYEARLGPRNRAYRILGIEFTAAGRPGTWYPDFGSGKRSIIVQLSQGARHDPKLALFQLGHEAFHLIEPVVPGRPGSFLEEGLASYFALRYLESQKIDGGDRYISESNYRAAYDAVVQLAASHDDFDARLRSLRKRTRSFSRVGADALKAAFPNASAQIIQTLAAPFRAANAGPGKR